MSISSLAKIPCLNCRTRHQKCDRKQPICRRCEVKGLDCRPVQRRPVFRHGSTANLDANFTEDQPWVNSRPRNWRPSTRSNRLSGYRSSLDIPNEQPDEEISPVLMDMPNEDRPQGTDYSDASNFESVGPSDIQNETQQTESPAPDATRAVIYSPSSFSDASSCSTFSRFDNGFEREQLCLTKPDRDIEFIDSATKTRGEDATGFDQAHSQLSDNQDSTKGSSELQESCLLRYFIEELSPWFDHCDERRHFQLVVPRRAQHCLALRNAVFAVSSRHLCRLPQYTTPQGIVYHGQAMPGLTKSTSLEYMLKCIPELIRFPEIGDATHQENIMAATVILRQYEEMEEELEEGEIQNRVNGRVNFLAITHTIIDTMISTPLDHSLATAAFWIAARQDVYHALTRQQAPEFRFGLESRRISPANTMIIFASEVAQWRWGTKEPRKWEKLKEKLQRLKHDYLPELATILHQKADRARGNIFPTLWYSFETQVTAVQHLKLGEMILIAESPYLEKARGPVHRKAEAQVREIVLCLCGIALNHPKCQPALVTAVIAITLYGEYFTRQDEREALLSIIDRTMELHAWPMRKAYQSLNQQWEMVDNIQL